MKSGGVQYTHTHTHNLTTVPFCIYSEICIECEYIYIRVCLCIKILGGASTDISVPLPGTIIYPGGRSVPPKKDSKCDHVRQSQNIKTYPRGHIRSPCVTKGENTCTFLHLLTRTFDRPVVCQPSELRMQRWVRHTHLLPGMQPHASQQVRSNTSCAESERESERDHLGEGEAFWVESWGVKSNSGPPQEGEATPWKIEGCQRPVQELGLWNLCSPVPSKSLSTFFFWSF